MYKLQRAIPISSNKNFSQVLKRLKGTFVIAEHDNTKLSSITLNAVTTASKLGKDVTCLIAGSNCGKAAEQLLKVKGVSKILVADNGAVERFLSERLTPLILASQKLFNFTHIIAGASAFGKSLLPRFAVKLNVSRLTDAIGIKDTKTFIRTIHAGNAVMTLKSSDPIKVVAVRGTSFEAGAAKGGSGAQEVFSEAPSGTDLATFVKQELSKTDHPELSSAAKKDSSDGRRLMTNTSKSNHKFYSVAPTSILQQQSNSILSNFSNPQVTSIRTIMRDYWPRPNEVRRIRRHGWKKRISTPGGRKIIMRRILKGRYILSH